MPVLSTEHVSDEMGNQRKSNKWLLVLRNFTSTWKMLHADLDLPESFRGSVKEHNTGVVHTVYRQLMRIFKVRLRQMVDSVSQESVLLEGNEP